MDCDFRARAVLLLRGAHFSSARARDCIRVGDNRRYRISVRPIGGTQDCLLRAGPCRHLRGLARGRGSSLPTLPMVRANQAPAYRVVVELPLKTLLDRDSIQIV